MHYLKELASDFTDSWWKRMLFFIVVFSFFISIFLIFIQPINNSLLIYAISMVLIALITSFIIENARKGSRFYLLGFHYDRHLLKNIKYVLVISSTGFCLYIFILLLFQVKITFFEYFEISNIILITCQILLLAFFEELVFRGLLFQTLMERFGEVSSTIFLAFIFALVHMTNPYFSIMSMINIFLMSIALSLIFVITRSLILVTIYHFIWNAFQALILGWNVSGYNFYYSITYFESEFVPRIISGGNFGMENSIVVTFIITVSIYLFHKRLNQSPEFSSLLFKRDYYQEVNT